MHSDRAPELKGKKVRRFLVRNDAVPLRGASNRSTTHSREEAFVKRALRGTRVMLRSSGLSIKYWPHAALTFTVNTNWRRCNHGLKRNGVPLRVIGHLGTAVMLSAIRDKQEFGPTTKTRVLYLSPVVETAGAVWALLPDGSVRDILDRDVT